MNKVRWLEQFANDVMVQFLSNGSLQGTVEGTFVKKHGPERTRVAIAVLVTLAVITATVVRLSHLPFVRLEYPIIDEAAGGLFLAFASEIADNGFRLPASIPYYTDGGIPFAYPPLGLYVEAVLVYRLGIPDYIVVNVLPPLITLLTVPSFYLLTGVLGLKSETRLMALFVFAIAGTAFSAQIEAAGLAEAAGTLTLIWLAIGLSKVGNGSSLSWWHILTGVSLGLCVMASPGSAYASAVLCMLFTGWQMCFGSGARSQTLKEMMVVAATGFLVSAIYVIPTLANHGPGIFLGPFANQHGSPGHWILDSARALLQFSVLWSPREGFFLNAVVAFGLLHEVTRRRWWLVVWLGVWLTIPREGDWLAAIPGCILAGIGIRWLLSICIERWPRRQWRFETFYPAVAVILLLMVFGLSAALFEVQREVKRTRAPAGFVEVLTRSSSTLPEDAKVITLVGDEDWSPFLTKRDVLNMRFGAEWQPSEEGIITGFNDDVEGCLDLGCVYSLAWERFGYQELYFIATKERLYELCGGTLDVGACYDVDIIESGDGAVVGKFDNTLS